MCKNLKDEFKKFIKNSATANELSRKLTNLEQLQDNLIKDIEDLHRRYSDVVKQLKKMYERYTSELKNKLKFFHAEGIQLKKLQKIQENTTFLLSKPYSTSFIPKCKQLLVEQTRYLAKRSRQPNKNVKYEQPPKVSSKEFKSLCDNTILGFVTYENIDEEYVSLSGSFPVQRHQTSNSSSRKDPGSTKRLSRFRSMDLTQVTTNSKGGISQRLGNTSTKTVLNKLPDIRGRSESRPFLQSNILKKESSSDKVVSPALLRTRSVSLSGDSGRSPVDTRVHTRSKSLVDLPSFILNPQKGAAEQLSHTPSRTSLNTIGDFSLDKEITKNMVCEIFTGINSAISQENILSIDSCYCKGPFHKKNDQYLLMALQLFMKYDPFPNNRARKS